MAAQNSNEINEGMNTIMKELQDLITKWEQKIVSINEQIKTHKRLKNLESIPYCIMVRETIFNCISDLKKLNMDAVKRSDEVCDMCGKHIRMHSQGIIRPLCECDRTKQTEHEAD